MIETLIREAIILDDIEVETKIDAIDVILDAGIAADLFTKPQRAEMRKKLLAREELGSTGIGGGVAIPHVKSDKLDAPFLMLGRSKNGLEYQAIDGQAVHTVFLLGSPEDRADDHLAMLRWISSLARHDDFQRFFVSAAGESEIRELLTEMSPK